MTYKDLISNPKDGIYTTSANTKVMIEGSHIVHSPRGMTIDDDEETELVSNHCDDCEMQDKSGCFLDGPCPHSIVK